MCNSVKDINKIINYGFKSKYSFLNLNILEKDIKKYNGYIILYIIEEESLRFWIIEKYFFPKVKKIKILKNLLKNDKSITYLLYLDEVEEELIYTIHYLYYFNFDILVKNEKLENILNYKNYNELNFIDEYNRFFEIYEKLNEKYFIKNKFFFHLFQKKYIKPIVINFAKAELISNNYFKKNNKSINELYQLYDSLLIDMLGVKENDLKRSTELFYLKKFRDIFPDTIYQYKPEWLGRQSLDLYIPSKQVGIEIQGEQHYKAIGFFGGEQQLLKQKKLDNKKKLLCKNNNVKLFYISNCAINYENTTFNSIVDEIKNIK